MAETLVQPPTRSSDGASGATASGAGGRLLRRWVWPLGAVLLLALSAAIVLWARTRPGFDPYGWLVWGRQTLRWNLDTNAAPSWKPLPYLFTVPYAVVGHYGMWLWMVSSVAISLAGVVFAGRIAYRLVGGFDAPTGAVRWGAWAAAIVAAVGVLEIDTYTHYILSAQSDPMIVALCLGAIDCHWSGRERWALVLGTLASLGRPEVWPFLAIYVIWAWVKRPAYRWLIAVCVLALGLLWFGIPALTSRTAFQAGTNALGSGRALHSNRVFGTIGRFTGLHETPLEIVALLSALFALWRRDRMTVALALGVVGWVAIEIAFVLHGWPGNPRYMFEAAAVMAVVAAIGVGRLVALAPSLSSLRLADASSTVSRLAAVVGAVLGVAIAATLVPVGMTRARTERADLNVQRVRTDEINKLAGVIRHYGGAAFLRTCGEPLTRLEYQSALAYTLGVNVSSVGYKYSQALAHGNPVMFFSPESGGWRFRIAHQRPGRCRALPGL